MFIHNTQARHHLLHSFTCIRDPHNSNARHSLVKILPAPVTETLGPAGNIYITLYIPCALVPPPCFILCGTFWSSDYRIFCPYHLIAHVFGSEHPDEELGVCEVAEGVHVADGEAPRLRGILPLLFHFFVTLSLSLKQEPHSLWTRPSPWHQNFFFGSACHLITDTTLE